MFFFFAFIDCVAILCLKLKFVNLFRLPKNSLQLIQSKQRHISAERASDLAGGPAFKERNNAIGWSFDRLCACFRGDARPHSSELRLGCCVFYYYYFFLLSCVSVLLCQAIGHCGQGKTKVRTHTHTHRETRRSLSSSSLVWQAVEGRLALNEYYCCCIARLVITDSWSERAAYYYFYYNYDFDTHRVKGRRRKRRKKGEENKKNQFGNIFRRQSHPLISSVGLESAMS